MTAEVNIVLNKNEFDEHIYLLINEKIDDTSYFKESYNLSMLFGKNVAETIFEKTRTNPGVLLKLYNKYFCRNNDYSIYIDDPKAKEKIKRAMIENINKNIRQNAMINLEDPEEVASELISIDLKKLRNYAKNLKEEVEKNTYKEEFLNGRDETF